MSILAVAVGALVLDRVFLAPGEAAPGRAAAKRAGPAPGSPRAAPAAPARDEPAAAEGQRLAARLRAAAQAQKPDYSNIRDVFTVSQSWMERLVPAAPEDTSEAPAVPERPAHRLMAVMVGEKVGYAIIDGRCLLVGQERDGLKLISVGQDSAIVAENGVRCQLQLQKEPQQDGAEPISN